MNLIKVRLIPMESTLKRTQCFQNTLVLANISRCEQFLFLLSFAFSLLPQYITLVSGFGGMVLNFFSRNRIRCLRGTQCRLSEAYDQLLAVKIFSFLQSIFVRYEMV